MDLAGGAGVGAATGGSKKLGSASNEAIGR